MGYIRLKSTGKVHEVGVPDKCIDKYIYISKDGVKIRPNDIKDFVVKVYYNDETMNLLDRINQVILALRKQDRYNFEINISVDSKLGDNPIYKIKREEMGYNVFQSDSHKENIIISHNVSSFTFDAQNSEATSPLFILKQNVSSFDKQLTMKNFKFIKNLSKLIY